MKILVTGAEGFVGSNLIRKLSDEHDVIGLDYLISRNTPNIPRRVPYINLDLSRDNLSHLPKIDVVIHLASISIERISEKALYSAINYASMLNVLELISRRGISMILTSSGSVYGSGLNFMEDDPYNPMSLYALNKIHEERLAKYYHVNHDLDITVLRYSNCFGDITHIDNKYYPGKKDAIRIFMERGLRDQPLPLIAGQSRDFTFIDDIVDATYIVLGLKGYNVFNVATSIATNIEDIPPLIGEALSKDIVTENIPARKIDSLTERSLNINKISKYWKPRYSLKDGIMEYATRYQGWNLEGST